MEIEILKLLYDYMAARKMVDKYFIYKLVEIVVTYKRLHKYVSGAIAYKKKIDKTDDDDHITFANFNPQKNRITAIEKVFNFDFTNYDNYDYLFNEYEIIMYRNIYIAVLILHELEHASQEKQIIFGGDEIETRLLKTCYLFKRIFSEFKNFCIMNTRGNINSCDFLVFRQTPQLYTQFYNLDPSERLAQIDAYRNILAALNRIKDKIPNLYEFQTALLVEQMLRGYNINCLCPTGSFLKSVNRSDVWTSFGFYDSDQDQLKSKVMEQFNLEKRLRLGLPISLSEYERMNNWLYSTNKFNL